MNTPWSAPVGRGDDNTTSPRPTGAGIALLVLILFAVLAPLVGHGCHGDDVDHEPSIYPPLHATPTASSSR